MVIFGPILTQSPNFYFNKNLLISHTLLMVIDRKWSSRTRASDSVHELITAETSIVSPSSYFNQFIKNSFDQNKMYFVS